MKYPAFQYLNNNKFHISLLVDRRLRYAGVLKKRENFSEILKKTLIPCYRLTYVNMAYAIVVLSHTGTVEDSHLQGNVPYRAPVH